MSKEVGSAHVSIFPVFTGFRSKVGSEMASAGGDGGKAFAKGFAAAAPKLAGPSLKQLERDVAAASASMSRSRLAEADAAGKVRVAELQLAEATAKHGAESSQAAAASERLLSAQRRQEVTAGALAQATKRLQDAQEKVKRATADAADASSQAAAGGERSANRFVAGWQGMRARLSARVQADTEAALRSAQQPAESAGERAGRGFQGGLTRALSVATGVLAGGALFQRMFDGMKAGIGYSSDLGEAASKMAQVFGVEGAAAIDAFSAGSARALGQTKLDVENAAATFGVFGKAAGLTGADLSSFSTELVSLSTDLASFHNANPAEVVQALGAGLRGEAEPMRRFGVLMDDASLKAEALKQGIISSTKDALTPQQKTLAAHALILAQTKDAQGDFARTSEGTANQQRIFNASMTEFSGRVGGLFLPALNEMLAGMNDGFGPASDAMVSGLEKVVAGVTGVAQVLVGGNFNGEVWAKLGIAEDSGVIEFLFRVREAVRGMIDLVVKGDYTGDLWSSLGLAEDSPVVDFVLTMRDRVIELAGQASEAFSGLVRGLSAKPGTPLEGWAQVGADVRAAFEELLPVVTAVLDKTAEALTWAMDNQGPVTAALAVIGGAWLALTAIVEAHAFAMEVKAVGGLVAYIAQANVVQSVTKVWTALQWALNAALNANPIGLIVLAIAALVAGLAFAYQHSQQFRDFVNGLGAAVVAGWNGVVDFFKGLPAWFAGVWQGITTGIQSWWSGVQAWFAQIPTWFAGVLAQIGAFFSSLPQLAMQAFLGLVGAVGRGIGLAIGLILVLPELVTTIFSSMWGWLVKTAADAWNGFSAAVAAGVAAAVVWVVGLPAQIQAFLAGLWLWLLATATQVWTDVSTAFQNGVAAAVLWVAGLPAQVEAWFVDMVSSVAVQAGLLWTNVSNAFRDGIVSAVAFVRDLPGTIDRILHEAADAAGRAGQAIMDRLVGGILGGIEQAKAAASDAMDAVRRFFPHSPAPEGPFSGSGWGGWGEAVTDEFAAGLRGDRLARAAGVAMGELKNALVVNAPVAGLGGVRGGVGVAPGGIEVHVHESTNPELTGRWAAREVAYAMGVTS